MDSSSLTTEVPHQQNHEHEENKGGKVNRPQDSVGLFDLREVEVS